MTDPIDSCWSTLLGTPLRARRPRKPTRKELAKAIIEAIAERGGSSGVTTSRTSDGRLAIEGPPEVMQSAHAGMTIALHIVDWVHDHRPHLVPHILQELADGYWVKAFVFRATNTVVSLLCLSLRYPKELAAH